MLEKVISKTRPSYLPPKSRFEDQKHLSDWERMMKQSRIAGTYEFHLFEESMPTFLEKRRNEEKNYKNVGLRESSKLSSRYICGRRRFCRTGK
jgi:hypothetical protein